MLKIKKLTFWERRNLAYQYAVNNNKSPLCIDAYGQKGIPRYMEVIDNTGWGIPKYLIQILNRKIYF